MRHDKINKEEALKLLRDLKILFSFSENSCNCASCRLDKRLYNRRGLMSRLDRVFPLHIPYVYHYFFSRTSSLQVGAINSTQELLVMLTEVLRSIKISLVVENYCNCCGVVNKELDKTTGVCRNCHDNILNKCAICGEPSLNKKMDSITLEKERHTVCHSCVSDKLIRCEYCHDWAIKQNLPDKWIYLTKFYEVSKKSTKKVICDTCVEHTTENGNHKCGVCGRTHFYLHGSNKNCGRCDIFRVPVHRHDFKPPMIYFNRNQKEGEDNPSRPLYFGVELEFENIGSEYSRQTSSKLITMAWGKNFVYGVHDGSLESRDTGIEIVSMPFTWGHWEQNESNWMNMLYTAQKNKFIGDGKPRAGCHIHMSMTAFTTFHLYKFTTFMFKPSVRNFVLGISNRVNKKDREYWSFNKERYGNTKALARNKENNLVRRVSHNFRRSAVNITPKTVELRIFQSTNKIEVLKTYMEFCVALYRFSRDNTPKSMLVRNFYSYILENNSNDNYHNLINFIHTTPSVYDNYSFIKHPAKKEK